MARPKKDDHEKLTETVTARLALVELEHVRVQAAAAGISVSEYLRRRAMGYQVVPGGGAVQVDPMLIAELNRIGVNVNQLARHFNAGRTERQVLDVVLAELRGVLGQILDGPGR